MKTEFLKSLGIDDQDVINKIMAENGKDINAAKGNTEQLQTGNESLKEQLKDRDNQLKDLKKLTTDNEALTNKITELQDANKKAQKQYDDKLAEMQKSHAIESAVRDAKAKNAKAVIALLDADKITMKDGELFGISEQLKALSEGEDTSFLFESTQPAPQPSGTSPGNNPNNNNNPGNPTGDRALGGVSLADGIASALKARNNS